MRKNYEKFKEKLIDLTEITSLKFESSLEDVLQEMNQNSETAYWEVSTGGVFSEHFHGTSNIAPADWEMGTALAEQDEEFIYWLWDIFNEL